MWSCKFTSIWLCFTPDSSTLLQSRMPDVQISLCSLIACDKSNRNLLGSPTAPWLPHSSSGHCSPNRLTTLVTSLGVTVQTRCCCCPASGPGMQNYG